MISKRKRETTFETKSRKRRKLVELFRLNPGIFEELPLEIVVSHIMPYTALDWLYVSKEWHELAYQSLLSDPRFKLSNSTFVDAARCGSIRGLAFHVQHADTIDIEMKTYDDAMTEAIDKGHMNIVEYLIEELFLDVHHDYLTTATGKGQHRILKYFLDWLDNDEIYVSYNDEYVSMFDTEIRMKASVLMPLAIMHGHFKAFKVLFKKVSTTPEGRRDATYAATKYSQYKILRYLERHNFLETSNPFVNWVFTENVEKGHTKIVRLLLRHLPVQSDILVKAINKNQLEVVKVLLADPKIDPSFNRNEALRTAVMTGNITAAKILLEDPRVGVCGQNRHMLIRLAVSNNSAKMVKLILNFPEVDPAGVVEEPTITDTKKLTVNPTTFDIAVSHNSLKIIRILLADKRINAFYYTGYTIAIALRMNRISIARTLLNDEKTTLIDSSHYQIIVKLAVKKQLLDVVTKVSELRRQNLSAKNKAIKDKTK
eukprot:TRINITY_DN5418_c0_g1_i1.p1 TRINITY_DN5418_c0_g1~~TRINITY_DN5418_c0_g1_i1.p1  ORF type:complete len:485 (-),score=79.51 TRINITY_DN5418_c0_g1_i1:7-1461(-)